jgi:hypothetical protein
MRHSTYNNKRLIWESRTKQIWIVAGSLLFVAAAIWTKNKTSPFMFWATIIFFGGGGLFMLVRLLNPKNLFVTHDAELGKTILAEQFLKDQDDLGFFEYNDKGFSLTDYKGVTHYNWSDIETIFGFKEDQMTTDEICLDIFFNNKSSIRLTESTLGWYQFNKQLTKAIPTIPENWDGEIMLPAFATNMTLLFDKNGKTKDEAETECYND